MRRLKNLANKTCVLTAEEYNRVVRKLLLARGTDPTVRDFAKELGVSKIIGIKNRKEKVFVVYEN